MRYVWTILLIMFLVIALLACQPSTQIQDTRATANSSGSTPENHATETLPQEVPDMTPVTPPDETTAKMVLLVTEHLAKKLGVGADQIQLSEAKPAVWRDAGLGCPKPGVDYIQVQTPGYNIRLEAGGKSYNYHTDETKRFVLCSK